MFSLKFNVLFEIILGESIVVKSPCRTYARACQMGSVERKRREEERRRGGEGRGEERKRRKEKRL